MRIPSTLIPRPLPSIILVAHILAQDVIDGKLSRTFGTSPASTLARTSLLFFLAFQKLDYTVLVELGATKFLSRV